MKTPLFFCVLALLVLAAPAAAEDCKKDRHCGISSSDWCCSPEWDPCGKHRSTAECKKDPNCEGMPYRGESAVPCISDGAGFAVNCPSVGCISRCAAISADGCKDAADRCVLESMRCVPLKK